MKVGIISDTHGSLSAWNKAWPFLKETDLILHGGDILYHGPRNPLPDGYDPQGLAKTLNGLDKPLIIVQGNCDAQVDQMMLDTPIESPYAHLIIDGLGIFCHHGHALTVDAMPLKIAPPAYALIVSGHSHLPSIVRDKGMTFLNPGSPSLPKNDPKRPTMAILEDRKIAIIAIDNGEHLVEATL